MYIPKVIEKELRSEFVKSCLEEGINDCNSIAKIARNMAREMSVMTLAAYKANVTRSKCGVSARRKRR